MNVRILTDSASDLPLSFYNENDVTLLPLGVHIDDQNFEDLTTITPTEVYNVIREGKQPKTSQVSPALFKEVFTQLAKDQQPSIYLTFSSELSGTYQTALLMKTEVEEEYPDLNLTIIDSKCASLGLGLVVKHAAELAQEGLPKEEILQSIQHDISHMEHLFTVEDLEYLARGGRVSKASAYIGGLLNIKPLLHVEDGKLIPIEKIRGKKKLMKRIIELMKERGDNLEEQTIGISHGDDEALANEIKTQIEETLGCKSFFINTIGAAIGSHVGPGTLAIFFLNSVKK
ncbi:DegV family protein [Bacillus timonensis]|nr:DegV family protein [Bacillus timonensis]